VFAPDLSTVVYQRWFDDQSFAAGEQRTYPVAWRVPESAEHGTYWVSLGVFAPGWTSLYNWTRGAVTFPVTAPASLPGLRVQGNRIVDSTAQAITLRGVNRSGTEYMCIYGWGTFDGPNDADSIAAIASWRANAVRVPLNEDCWLAINGVDPAYAGLAYQQAIKDYVALLNGAGLYAILELHWSAPGATPAKGQQPMPDLDHSPAFWSQVAATFKGNDAVIFDLFNEPYPGVMEDSDASWTCWRDGGTCSGITYQVAGMQSLVDAVRGTGATNVIALSGLHWSNLLSRWLAYEPVDPLNNLVAAWHVYEGHACNNVSCYDGDPAAVAARVPLLAMEIGAPCNAPFLASVMGWLDARQSGYLAWTWDTWGPACSAFALVVDYSGAPTPYGQTYKDHLAQLP
jgi:endoglucanase